MKKVTSATATATPRRMEWLSFGMKNSSKTPISGVKVIRLRIVSFIESAPFMRKRINLDRYLKM
jgi:hypothetical protein